MPIVDWETIKIKLLGPLDTKTAAMGLEPPRLLVAENCYAEKTGQFRKRKGTTTLTTTTLDNGSAVSSSGTAALARYKDALVMLGNPNTPNSYELSETANRWTEHGEYAPGVLTYQNLPASGGDGGATVAEAAHISGYTLLAAMETSGSALAGTGETSLRITLQDASGTFLCNRLRVWTDPTLPSTTTDLRVVAVGSQFYVFFYDWTNADIRCWILSVASVATITTGIGTSSGSPASTVLVANDAGPVAAFDVCASGSNGIFLGYRTSTANQIKWGFVNASGTLASTSTAVATGPVAMVSVAMQNTAVHSVSYINGAASDVFAVLLSWSGAAWTVTSTSAAIDAFAGDPAMNLATRWDSATTLRLWYTADRTSGTAPTAAMGTGANTDTARHKVYQSTYTTGGVATARVVTLRRAVMVSQPFVATDTKIYFWALVGYRPSSFSTGMQPTHHLIESSTGLPVATAHAGVGSLWSLLGSCKSVVNFDSKYVAAALYLTRGADGAGGAPVIDIVGTTYAGNVGVRFVEWMPEHPQSHKIVEVGDSLYMAGGMPQQYDGVRWVETGFLRRVESDVIHLAVSNTAGGALTSSAIYYYRLVWEYVDARGQRQQSADNGPTVSVTLGAADDTVTITAPSLIMTRKRQATGQTAGSGVVLAIYRTAANPATSAATMSRVGTVANSTTADTVSYTDTLSDDAIADNEPLAQHDGEVAHFAPPACLIMAEGNGRVFVAGSEEPNTIHFSLTRQPGDPVTFSPGFTIVMPDFGGAITALAVMGESLIVFKRTAIYRVRGPGPTNTLTEGTFYDPELLQSHVGCIGQRSVVVSPLGTAFQAERGFHIIDLGMNVSYFGAQLEGLTGSQAVSETNAVTGAVLLPLDQQIRITSTSIVWVFDYFHQIWSVYTDQSITGPSVEYGGAHTWAASTILQESADELFTAANWRIKLAPLRLPREFRVRRVGVTGEVTTTANLRINLYRDFSTTVGQTIVVSGIDAGPHLTPYRVISGMQICEAMTIEIDDNATGSAGALAVSEICFEVGIRPRTSRP